MSGAQPRSAPSICLAKCRAITLSTADRRHDGTEHSLSGINFSKLSLDFEDPPPRSVCTAFVAGLGLPGGSRAWCPPSVIVFLGLLCSQLARVLPIMSLKFRLSKEEAKHLSHGASWALFILASEQVWGDLVIVGKLWVLVGYSPVRGCG